MCFCLFRVNVCATHRHNKRKGANVGAGEAAVGSQPRIPPNISTFKQETLPISHFGVFANEFDFPVVFHGP